MSETREQIEKRHGPVEVIGESSNYEVIEDSGGDCWVGKTGFVRHEYTILVDRHREDFIEALRSAGVLEGAESGSERFHERNPVATAGHGGVEAYEAEQPGKWPYAITSVSHQHFYGDADLLRELADAIEEHEEDPAPSPEDVSETWIKATDGRTEKYGPHHALDTDPDGSFPFVLKPAYDSGGKKYNATRGFGAGDVETVDAADVPFSEVPVDE